MTDMGSGWSEDERIRLRQNLMSRIRSSYDTKDQVGRRTVWRDDVPRWRYSAGAHLIDIIPYKAGHFDPDNKYGEETYVLILWVHRVGPNRDNWLCLRNWNKRCPACEFLAWVSGQEDFDDQMAESLIAKRRSFYNIWVQDTPQEQDKGVQVFDVAHFFMEKHLAALSRVTRGRAGTPVGSFIPFPDPIDGQSIAFEIIGKGKNQQWMAHRLVERDYVLSKDFCQGAYVLDECIVIPTYDELKNALEIAGLEIPSSGTVEPQTTPQKLSKGVKEYPPQAEERENPCPAGGQFGTDIEKLDMCGTCEVWDSCATEANKGEEIPKEEAMQKEEKAHKQALPQTIPRSLPKEQPRQAAPQSRKPALSRRPG